MFSPKMQARAHLFSFTYVTPILADSQYEIEQAAKRLDELKARDREQEKADYDRAHPQSSGGGDIFGSIIAVIFVFGGLVFVLWYCLVGYKKL